MEYLDLSGVRTRISFALGRMGAPLVSIPYLLDQGAASEANGQSGTADRLAALRGIGIFGCLNEDELLRLAERMKPESFAAGEIILRQGEPGSSAYIVRQGRVRILLMNDSGISEQVASLEPGDFFGEMSLLTGEPRNATAVAADRVVCYRLSKPDLHSVFSIRPELAGQISALLAERQAGLTAARDKLTETAAAQRQSQTHQNVLARIRNYFQLE